MNFDKISKIDYELLQKKYPEKMDWVEEQLKNYYPVQYLIGNVDFYDTWIEVNENVLIPRFETELLVKKTIDYAQKLNLKNPNILDIGTGSGCIAIALKHHFPCEVTAMDISKTALKLAKKNAVHNHVVIHFKQMDMKKSLAYGNYDIIISNPPYVDKNEVVDKETRFEPQKALYAENHGLEYYQVILEKIKEYGWAPKLIAFEIGCSQAKEVKKLAINTLENIKVLIEPDFTGKDRYIFIIKR